MKALCGLLILCVACDGGAELTADAGSAPDGAPTADATAGSADGSPYPLDGFGTLSGDCDVLDSELRDPTPSTFQSAIDFAAPYTEADLSELTPGGQEIIADDNAGGSSLLSEVFAYEVLARCERAALLKTELEIAYDTAGKLTDFLVDIDGDKIGVSVTRAVGFPMDAPYTVEQALALVEGKLSDIIVSSQNVSAADAWRKQILAVVAYGPMHAESIAAALEQVSPAVRTDTIVWIVVTDGADDFIY